MKAVIFNLPAHLQAEILSISRRGHEVQGHRRQTALLLHGIFYILGLCTSLQKVVLFIRR